MLLNQSASLSLTGFGARVKVFIMTIIMIIFMI